ncbi:phage tail assembly protein [Hydrogenophaga sp.]|uniref:phage tail assembly protein n=1 Tax=Hydrogenophaga sp. TaxID=1904254 RepID=UPI003F72C801
MNADHTVTLDQPIQREGQSIAALTLRKPASGELRGLSLINLLQMDVESLATLLPRISSPTVHRAEVLAMDPADTLAAGIVVAGFLQQKGERAAFPNA